MANLRPGDIEKGTFVEAIVEIVPESSVEKLAYKIWEITGNPNSKANWYEALNIFRERGSRVLTDEKYKDECLYYSLWCIVNESPYYKIHGSSGVFD
ncbi:MAG: hypothetical protein V1892_00390 [bacterium]